MRGDPTKKLVSWRLFAVLVCCLFVGSLAAGPKGGVVVDGKGSIKKPNAKTTKIRQRSKAMVIDWDSFNLAADEQVNFKQRSRKSTVLNRIGDLNASQIDGSINARGKVFLSNPNGLYFGGSAQVNVGALIATSLRMDADDFMRGKYRLNPGNGGAVINQGIIEAANGGSVALIGNSVRNEGVIIANYGHVVLATGRQAVINFDGDGLLNFRIDQAVLQNTSGADDAIHNSGSIIADAGQILLSGNTSASIFDNVINNEGLLQATRIENRGGVIHLSGSGGRVISSGDINATGSNGSGGEVHMLGNQVGLFDDASIDVSGTRGGGVVLIGGDYQGNNADIENAEKTYVGEDVSIRADAIATGDGGKVIVWADDWTRFYGDVSARGGAESGDGGFVEVSGKQYLAFEGSADTRALNGKTGTLLLDPEDILITSGATGADDGLLSMTDGTIDFADVGIANPTVISRAQLEAVQATTSISLQANNSITIANLSGDNTLDLQQGNNNSVTFTATNGAFSMNTGDTIKTAGGSVNIEAASVVAGNITTQGSDGFIPTAGGAVSITASNGDLSAGDITTTGGTDNDTDGNAAAGGAVILNGTGGTITVGDIETSGGDINNNSHNGDGGNGGNVTIAGDGPDTALGDISLGNIDTRGGDAKNAGFKGGDSGTIMLTQNADALLDVGEIRGDGGNFDPGTDPSKGADAATTLRSEGAITVERLRRLGTVTITADNNGIGGESFTLSATGGASRATSITVNGTSSLQGTITTMGDQDYTGAVALTGDTTTTSSGLGDITFGQAITGGFSLDINTGGTGKIQGGATGLTTLTTDATGTTELQGTISTGGVQTYNDAVTLTGNTITTSSGASDITFGQAITGGFSLDINTGGTGKIQNGATGLTTLTTDATGTTELQGTISTGGVQAYNDAVTLTGNTTTTSSGVGALGDITFGQAITGGFSLDINTGGTGKIQNGATGLTTLTTNATGTTELQGTISTGGVQTYNDAVTLTGNTITTSSGVGALGDITFGQAITGGFSLDINTGGTGKIQNGATGLTTLTTDATGATELQGTISTGGVQAYNDAVTLTGNTITTSSGVGALGDITFGQAITGGFSLDINTGGTGKIQNGATGLTTLTTDATGTTELQGTISTSGAQDYKDTVTLTGATILSGTTLSNIGVSGGSVGAENDLTLTFSTATAIAGGFTNINDLVSNGTGGSNLAGAIATTGTQTYSNAVALTGNTITTSIGVGALGDITFGQAITGGFSLDINTGGTGKIQNGATGLTTLTTDATGTTELQGTISTSGAQDYKDTVTLTGATILSGTTLSHTGVSGGSVGAENDLTLTFSTATTINNSYTNINDLVSNGTGGSNLAGTITTTGTQTYNDAVTLAGATTTASTGTGSAGDITFAGAINGGTSSLTINTAGASKIQAGASGLTSLTTDMDGTTELTGPITTTGTQSYNDAVILKNNVVLMATDALAQVNFGKTVDADMAGMQSLVVSNGDATFTGAVGSTASLASLSVTELTGLNNNVTTSGNQDYTGAVTITGNAILKATDTNAQVNFGDTVTSNPANNSLTLDFSGDTTIVGTDFINFGSLTLTGGGTTNLTGTITTTGTQTYDDAVILNSNVNLSTPGLVSFNSTVDSDTTSRLLEVSNGDAAFMGAVGSNASLSSLSVAGTTNLGGNVTTTGTQAYTDAVTLAGDVVISTTTATFGNTLQATTDGGQSLTLSTGNAVFTGEVGGTSRALSSLSVAGTTNLGGNVTTTGAQTYTGAVTLTTAATTTTATTGDITFVEAITGTGTSALNINTSGTGRIQNGASGLSTLSTDANGSTELAGMITTTGAQTYGDAVTLTDDVVVSTSGSGLVSFNSTVDSDSTVTNRSLTVSNAGGGALFADNVGQTALSSLTVAGTTSIGGEITTTGAQTYEKLVTLAGAAVLTGTDPTFTAGVAGAGNDLTLAFSGITTIDTSFNNIGDLTATNAGRTNLTGGLDSSNVSGSLTVFADEISITDNITLTMNGGGINLTSTSGGDIILNGNVALTTSAMGGGIVLDASGMLKGTGDISVNSVGVTRFGANMTVNAKDNLTLESMAGIETDGKLDLKAGNEITIASMLDATGKLTFDAGGTLDIDAPVSSSGDIKISAQDLELDANLTSNDTVTISDKGKGISILGASGLKLSLQELESIKSDVLTLQSDNKIVLSNDLNAGSVTSLLNIDTSNFKIEGAGFKKNRVIILGGALDLGNSVVKVVKNSNPAVGGLGGLKIVTNGDFRMRANSSITNNEEGINISAKSGGSVFLGLLNAPGSTVSVTAGGDILNGFPKVSNVKLSKANVIADRVVLNASNRIGASSTDAVTLDIETGGLIDLTFGAPFAYINNLNATDIASRSGGEVLVGLIFSSQVIGIGHNNGVDSTVTVNPLDLAVYDDMIFGGPDIAVLGSEFRVFFDEDEEDEIVSTIIPTVPAMVKTLDGWEFVAPSRRQSVDKLRENQRKGEHFIDWL